MKTKQSSPGRPAYKPVLPNRKFTMTDLCEANGVSLKTGKGKNCSKLTLVKFIAKQLGNKRSGLIIKVKDETREPNSTVGLGRKAFVYIRRPGTKVATPAAKSNLKTAAKSKVSVKLAPASTTSDYEATKAALLAPTPTPVIAEAPAVVTEPAPVAPVAETSPAPAEPQAAIA